MPTTAMPALPFTQADFEAANVDWGCNCGPSALAFALQIDLDAARLALPQFESRCYTNVTMMRDALRFLKVTWTECRAEIVNDMFTSGGIALARIQWGGPWITPQGKPLRWAATATHWVTTWYQHGFNRVFDCNGGPQVFGEWSEQTVPAILHNIKRADGRFWPTHVWRIDSPIGGIAS